MLTLGLPTNSYEMARLIQQLPPEPAIAPHVLARLVAAVGTDLDALAGVIRRLPRPVLGGDEPLPLRLPGLTVSDDLQAVVAHLSSGDRHILLIAALAWSNDVDELAEAAGLDVDGLARTDASSLLDLTNRCITFRDTRLATAIQVSVSTSELVDAHAALAEVYQRRGQLGLAGWHASHATISPSQEVVGILGNLASDLLRAGDARRALEVAQFIASTPRVRLYDIAPIAARAALHAGHISAASEWRRLSGRLDISAQTRALLTWDTTPSRLTTAVPSMRSRPLLPPGTRWPTRGPEGSTPLLQARQVVGRSLAMLADGDVGAAQRLLYRAAYWLPVAVPCGGVGAVLARRIDLVIDGRISATARALDLTSPHRGSQELRMSHLVDEAITETLAGRYDRAAVLLRLERQRRADATPLPVQGLDEPEVWMLAGCPGQEAAPARRLPTDTARIAGNETADLRGLWVAVATATEPHVSDCLKAATAQLSDIRSPYERAHAELCAASVMRVRGSISQARAHLMAASAEFLEAGAGAWHGFAEQLLKELEQENTGTQPNSASAYAAPRSNNTPRPRWNMLLTAREVEVSQLVAMGASNREIGRQLGLSVRTVEVHLSRIYRKLGIQTRVELAVLTQSGLS